jgi:hypothetical protein
LTGQPGAAAGRQLEGGTKDRSSGHAVTLHGQVCQASGMFPALLQFPAKSETAYSTRPLLIA